MITPIWYIGIGIFFCLSGLYFFHRNAFEEDKKITQPVLLLLAGVLLIGMGMAKYYGYRV